MERKTWLITGISSGLGKSLANYAILKGDFVIGTFRQTAQVEQFNLENEGNGFAVKLDITNRKEIETTIEHIISKYQKIDVLVNNAGIGFIGAIEEASIEEVNKIFEANFFGTLKLTQEVLPYMREQKNGHIIQISSHGGIKAFAGFGIYNASKFALEGFSEALAQEVEPLGVKVSIIEPGPFRTKFANTSLIQAKKVITDYNETAGAFRKKLLSVDGKQEGDPKKAAEAIYNLTNEEKPRLRLPLGKTALFTIGMKLDQVKNDIEANKEIAEQAIF